MAALRSIKHKYTDTKKRITNRKQLAVGQSCYCHVSGFGFLCLAVEWGKTKIEWGKLLENPFLYVLGAIVHTEDIL
jgi:hypothetical protein